MILKKLTNLPEEEIMLLVSQGNHLAFRHIFEKNQMVVFACAQRITRSRPIAEDIVQDVFLKIWEYRKALGQVRHLKKYLLTMCKHSSLDWRAKKVREQQVREEMGHCEEAFHCDTENTVQHLEYATLLQDAIEGLPPKRKLIFTLCKMNGISYEEAAEQLDVSPGTINDHIVKGTRFVKEYLKKRDVSYVC